MEVKNLKELKTSLNENLKLVFSSNELINHISDDIFFKLILKLISLLFQIESKLNLTKKTSEKMLSELNVITKTHNTFMDVEIDEYFEVKDEINYLDVYLFNIYKKHLKDFVSDVNLNNSKNEKNDSANISSLDLPQDEKARNIDMPYKANDSPIHTPINSTYNQPFNNSSNININPQDVQEQVYYQIANQKIMQETKSGAFYIYDSKPKIVPLIKKIFYVFFCINGLIFLLPFLSYILSAGLIVPQWKDGVRIEEGPLGTDPFTCLTYLMFSIFSLFYGAKNLLKKETNENLIYYFNWYFFLFIAIFLVFSLFNLINNFSTQFKYLPEIIGFNSGATSSKLMWYQIYLYSTITSYSFIGLMCLMAIFMSFLNPKKDIVRINEKISQYVNEIKRQQQQQK
ncbi:MAG: hypothetical protein RSA87_00575 [Malacoplasma sp.]